MASSPRRVKRPIWTTWWFLLAVLAVLIILIAASCDAFPGPSPSSITIPAPATDVMGGSSAPL